MTATTILVIDDEPQIRRVVRNALQRSALLGPRSPGASQDSDIRVIEAGTATEGLDRAAAEQPGLIILDLGLPDGDGLTVCRDLRAFSQAPIIVLSARHQDREKVQLLDAGADDYMTKPFSTAELQARVRAHLRRGTRSQLTPDAAVLTQGELSVNLAQRTVKISGKSVHLTPLEWDVLRTFISHRNQTLTHRQLFLAVWGNAAGDAQQYLRVYVGQLRRKIEPDPLRPVFIKTEPGVGYRFEMDE